MWPSLLSSGCCVWDAAVVLLRFLEEELGDLLGPRARAGLAPLVVELGAGRGLVGLGAAAILTALAAQGDTPEDATGLPRRHSCHILLTDLAYCLANLRAAVALNKHFAVTLPSLGAPQTPGECLGSMDAPEGVGEEGPRAGISVEALDWFCPEKCTAWGPDGGPPLRTSLVVAADVLWLKELVEPFVRTLAFFAGSAAGSQPENIDQGHVTTERGQAPLIIVAHQTRSASVDSIFFSLLQTYGLSAEPLAYDGPQGGPPHKVTLFIIRREAPQSMR